jgi:hypothetical protein
MKFYDLWALHPGNLIGEYRTEAEALAAVRDLLVAGWSTDDLSLGWGDSEDDEQGGEIASGIELAARAATADPARPRRSA